MYLIECMIDWIKHAFITKFNKIPSAIYAKFMSILSVNIIDINKGHMLIDSSYNISKEIGFVR